MAINVTKPAINLREKLNEVTLETGIKGEELLNSDTSTEARNVLELDTHLFTDFESTGIDDNATSTAITIDASENVALAGTLTVPSLAVTGAATFIDAGVGGPNLSFENAGGNTKFRETTSGAFYYEAWAHHFSKSGGATTLTLTSSNNVEVATGNLVIGTSGKGIDFSAVSDGSRSVSSNLLDDYEEGTWTPTTSTGTMTFNAAKTVYTKIGNLVTINADTLSFSDITSTNGIVIGGLPFTTSASNKSIGAVISNYNDKASTISHITGNVLRVDFYQSNATGTWAEDKHSSLNSVSNTRHFTISYVV